MYTNNPGFSHVSPKDLKLWKKNSARDVQTYFLQFKGDHY
jgi:hypothetical protein